MRAVKQNCLVLFVKMDVALFFLLAFDLQIATLTIEDLNLENSRLKSLASPYFAMLCFGTLLGFEFSISFTVVNRSDFRMSWECVHLLFELAAQILNSKVL